MSLDKIEFFSAVDRKGKRSDGEIGSQYPAWYFRSHLDELQKELDDIERGLAMGAYAPEDVPRRKADARDRHERIGAIKSSRPKVSAVDRGKLEKVYAELSKVLAEALPTYSKMQRGLIDIHQEASLMVDPHFEVREIGDMFKGIGARITKGKVSRNEVVRLWKIIGRYLEMESTNVESLRKDHQRLAYAIEPRLDELPGA